MHVNVFFHKNQDIMYLEEAAYLNPNRRIHKSVEIQDVLFIIKKLPATSAIIENCSNLRIF